MHPHRPLPRPFLLLLLALALVTAACGGGAGGDGDDGADAAAEPADEAGAADTGGTEAADDAGGDDGAAVVALAETDLGEVLVDAGGLTLYGFSNDEGGTSSCTGDCAATWPPVGVDEGFAVGEGLDAATFGTMERDDGSLQLVAGDWPLYLFAGDEAPGDVNGQGVGGVWFAVTADGELVEGDTGTEGAASRTGPGTDY